MSGFQPFVDVLEFLELGGWVLVLITMAIVAIWALLFERGWFFLRVLEKELPHSNLGPGEYRDRVLEHALMVRRHAMSRRLPMIRALISVCPLLGLLGTVWGMIEVFEVTALAGSGNVRAIAAGVSTATVTTMAGLVASLSSLLFLVILERFVSNEQRRNEHQLVADGG